MIKKLRIKNFKGWRDTGLINMAPLTVFFGVNSSGKSSIAHLLLALKQTVSNEDPKIVIFAGDTNSPMQFGSMQNLLYHRDSKNNIEFDYLWDLDKPFKIEDAKNDVKYQGNAIHFSASIGINGQKTSEVASFKYDILNNNNLEFSIKMAKNTSKASYSIETEKYKLLRTTNRPFGIDSPIRFYGFPETVVANHQNAEFVQMLNLYHAQFFNAISYLGPLRNSPQRLYLWSGSEPSSVGYSGEYSIHAILAAHNRMINMKKGHKRKPFQAIIAEKLNTMGLIENFTVKAILEDQHNYEVKIRTKGSEDMVDLPDVGFGVSQVLPVLTQLFYAPAKSIIIMEQPEIHLHPSAQATLADVMIDAINSCEDGKERGIQLIIETHSEHFLRRLQRRIAEDVIPNEYVSAYFANVSNNPITLDPLKIDSNGNISNWPKNFFGDEMGDITAQSLAAINKRIMRNK